jgi:superfamily II DNA or RNA helicase
MSKTIINARVDSELSLDHKSIPKSLRWAIAQHFVIKNPELEKRRKIGLDSTHVQRHVNFYRMRSGPTWEEEMVLPRGAYTTVSSLASRNGASINVDGNIKVTKRSCDLVPLMDLGVNLRDYQQQAVKLMLDRVQGYIALPCGAGKTVLGAAAIVASGQPSIVLVHTEDLLLQWCGVFENMYACDVRKVSSGGGDYRWRPLKDDEICVAMVQTLHANQLKRGPLLKSAGAVLLDECHHAPADSFRSLFKELPARYRWGLTATPDRPDGWGCLLPMFIGPMLYSMKPRHLVEQGFLIMPSIVPISTGVSVPLSAWGKQHGGTKKSAKALNYLCDDEERKELLVEISMIGAEDGRTCLILVPRVKLAYWLADQISMRGIDCKAVTGKMHKKARERALSDLRKGRLQAVVATQLADEGLDVPNLDFLVNASTGKAGGRAIQRIGRAMRVCEGKATPVVVDLVDQDPVYHRQWQARALAYRNAINAKIPALVSRTNALSALLEALKNTRKR